ncbi:MAG: hypothetical protein ACQESP_06865 [Candidatus Muiribacteriota bacterium]
MKSRILYYFVIIVVLLLIISFVNKYFFTPPTKHIENLNEEFSKNFLNGNFSFVYKYLDENSDFYNIFSQFYKDNFIFEPTSSNQAEDTFFGFLFSKNLKVVSAVHAKINPEKSQNKIFLYNPSPQYSDNIKQNSSDKSPFSVLPVNYKVNKISIEGGIDKQDVENNENNVEFHLFDMGKFFKEIEILSSSDKIFLQTFIEPAFIKVKTPNSDAQVKEIVEVMHNSHKIIFDRNVEPGDIIEIEIPGKYPVVSQNPLVTKIVLPFVNPRHLKTVNDNITFKPFVEFDSENFFVIPDDSDYNIIEPGSVYQNKHSISNNILFLFDDKKPFLKNYASINIVYFSNIEKYLSHELIYDYIKKLNNLYGNFYNEKYLYAASNPEISRDVYPIMNVLSPEILDEVHNSDGEYAGLDGKKYIHLSFLRNLSKMYQQYIKTPDYTLASGLAEFAALIVFDEIHETDLINRALQSAEQHKINKFIPYFHNLYENNPDFIKEEYEKEPDLIIEELFK